MENLIKSSIRVQRQIDNVEDLSKSFPDLEALALSNPSSITDEDKRRVLDFPESEMQATNIAATTSLSKKALLQQAAELPDLLTQAEVDLLKNRYWLDLSRAESGARSKAGAALVAVSQAHFDDITSRLSKMREPLYEENEGQAIANAEDQALQRLIAFAMGPQDAAQAVLAKARPWVRKLWDEIKDEPQRRWGYPVFVEPGYEQMDDYLSRRDAVLFHARGAICCGDTMGARWKLQKMDWPVVGKKRAETTEALEARFDSLRESFKSVVDRAPKKQRVSHETETRNGGLEDGILDNVFLVIDRESIDTVMSDTGFVDDMWVWAIDPDFENATKEGAQEEFRGYMRVRLQQLVNNFFEQRYFHAEEQPLSSLWKAATTSKNRAFVSVKEDEADLWTGNRSIGSGLRP
ncbi:uncharacterized protein GGS22DRAFT_150283 [Annulohypoxylon maeteangense]|uniref:uncharacterized protein n=1 Tax=Annulohypoxylon maeteangense TaxID=1927788 RepID=UPI0020075253|nr:uncharacterized protein GGS22DRAFT_150283 [Annulohypoxylon maeteangense]KAI0890229.1 hypothetical protein GGS22DRAFT_150283 [Annulohypoxylon maeteangense]